MRILTALVTFILFAPLGARAWPGTLLAMDGNPVGSKHFPAPEELEPAVRFWVDIFTKHDSGRVVVHDREHMNIIWQVLELPKNEAGDILEERAREIVRKANLELRDRLRRLEIDPVPLDDEDQILLTLAGGNESPHLNGAWLRIRSQRGVADHFEAGIQRARDYLHDIRPILEEEGVPTEICALPFVESMYNPRARSSAGAAGLWQLMPATARSLRLDVSAKNDERLDVKKSTRAAAKMLRDNYRMLGSWPLAITGYNHGPYGVRRAVNAAGSTDLIYLIENYKKSTWGFASKNFYAEFLAAMSILANQEKDLTTVVKAETATGEVRLID